MMASIEEETSKFFRQLNDLRKENKFCDVVVKIQDRRFPCHRVILSASLDYFSSLFGGDFIEKSKFEVELQDIPAEDFDEILNFIYTRKACINESNAVSLLQTSDYLGLHCMEHLCAVCISQNIPIPNAVNMLLSSIKKGNTNLSNRLIALIAKNFSTYSKDINFVHIPVSELVALLSHQDLEKNEESTEQFILSWINCHSSEEIEAYLPVLLDTAVVSTFQIRGDTLLKLCTKNGVSYDIEENSFIEDESELKNRHCQSVKLFISKDVFNEISLCTLMSNGTWYRRKSIEINESYESLRMKTVMVENFIYSYCCIRIRNFNVGNYEVSNSLYMVTDSSENSTLCLSTALSPPPESVPYSSSCFSRDRHNNRLFLLNKSFSPSSSTALYYTYSCEENRWYPRRTTGHFLNLNSVISVLPDKDNMYVIGKAEEEFSGVCVQFEDRTGKWHKFPYCPSVHNCGAACINDGKIYISGGDYYSYFQKRMEVFDIKAGKWQQLADMPYPKMNHHLVANGKKIWAVGGERAYNQERCDDWTMFLYDIDKNSWSLPITIYRKDKKTKILDCQPF